MENIADNVHIGELIAVSKVFLLNPYQMVTLLENGEMEVFENKEAFFEKYGNKETYDELSDWCELNNGKIFTKTK
ncbi:MULTISPECIES: hypothetical protein [Neobacillus]|uniref:Uncharacterized protein n=1 Tax=Neobacillus rhizophilus TaxID=2833579 RepID=A0A942U9J7_9BACI|nr:MULTISPECIES: hypothetical protein [Neobacillus]MBS4215117.1 hypothetical protein [Neobacillus rhizophilus]MBU8919273.1 hypothetical protein [Bacillus sp. FJAT-29953]